MFIKDLDEISKTITVAVPLTKGTEKTRIKKRSLSNEYGLPVATKKEPFTQECYVEWQIGYDVATDDTEKLARTTLTDKLFTGANGKEKALYELSEYIYYFHRWGIVSAEQIDNIRKFLSGIDDSQLLDINEDYVIERSWPVPQKLFGIDFEYTQVKYPLFIHKFHGVEIISEIKISEKQYAIGVQPMLYVCFPVTELTTQIPLLGRVAETKENADFIITPSNIGIFLETLKIFGILSKNHKADILSIIDVILA